MKNQILVTNAGGSLEGRKKPSTKAVSIEGPKKVKPYFERQMDDTEKLLPPGMEIQKDITQRQVDDSTDILLPPWFHDCDDC